MSRADDTLLKIKQEIQNDPAGRGYAGKSPSEIAILMSQAVSKNPNEFVTIPGVLTTDYILARLKSKFPLVFTDADNPTSTQVEVLQSRADVLSLGELSQGDVEQALK